MRPRPPIRRILYLRPFRPPNPLRPFTQNSLAQLRPQLPFLAPSARRPIARFLTTETKKWIKDEVWLAGKYTAILWTTGFLVLLIVFGVQEERLDRKYPSPPEWSWFSRKDYRTARNQEEGDDDGLHPVDWASTGAWYLDLIKRLEDSTIDGAGLQEQAEGGILVAGVGKTGFDTSAKSEEWKRGYVEALMGAARCAEHLDGFVLDRTRNIFFPANMVIGPSNPNPRPIPAGSKSAPREEDCEQGFPPPETWYMRVLTTQGLTEKQRLDAALAYAAWLDYKRSPEASSEMYKWALDIATASLQTPKPIVDPATGVLNTNAGLPSANVLSVTTALAVHHALNSNLDYALPIFLSILRARRSLPEVPPTMLSTLSSDEGEKEGFFKILLNLLNTAFTPSKYPPPLDDGTSPPLRTSKETCEEAGIMTYIGEILYVSKLSKTSKEEGLAWTREAVDIAEEQLRKKDIQNQKEAKKACRQCLEVGLGNWDQMVNQLAEQEKAAKKESKSGGGSWLGFGGEVQSDVAGRWESEEQVVKERIRRARDVLEEDNKPPPSSGLLRL